MKLLLDENVSARVAVQLRKRGHDALAAVDAGLAAREASDEEVLAFAAREGRVLVTYDVSDFPDIARSWHAMGRRFPGIILVHSKSFPQADVGRLVRRLAAFLAGEEGRDWHPGAVLFLEGLAR